jgi:hypothetical protein
LFVSLCVVKLLTTERYELDFNAEIKPKRYRSSLATRPEAGTTQDGNLFVDRPS